MNIISKSAVFMIKNIMYFFDQSDCRFTISLEGDLASLATLETPETDYHNYISLDVIGNIGNIGHTCDILSPSQLHCIQVAGNTETLATLETQETLETWKHRKHWKHRQHWKLWKHRKLWQHWQYWKYWKHLTHPRPIKIMYFTWCLWKHVCCLGSIPMIFSFQSPYLCRCSNYAPVPESQIWLSWRYFQEMAPFKKSIPGIQQAY